MGINSCGWEGTWGVGRLLRRLAKAPEAAICVSQLQVKTTKEAGRKERKPSSMKHQKSRSIASIHD
jgi:hypothetical protein